MDKNITYMKPIKPWQKKQLDDKKWYKAKKLYEEKKYDQSLEELFAHIDKKSFKKYKIKWTQSYLFPSYKNWIKIEKTNEKIFIEMDVVELSKENFMFIARQLTLLNYRFFNLPKIVIENNIVKVKYWCYLDAAHPLKIWSCIREFWHFSSIYTEEFIDYYDAKLTKTPDIQYYSEEKYQEILNEIQRMLSQAKEYCNYFEWRMEYNHSWDILFQTILNLSVAIDPVWSLKKDFNDIINIMWDNSLEWREQYSKWQIFLKKFEKFTTEDLKKYVFEYKNFLARKSYYTEDEISERFRDALGVGKQFKEEENNIKWTLNQAGWILSTLSNGNIELKVNYNMMIQALIKSSNKPWKKSLEILNNTIKNLVIKTKTSNISYYILFYFAFLALAISVDKFF